MPTPDQQPPHQPALLAAEAPQGMPEPEHDAGHETELHYKTLAFKLEEETHAKLHFIAQLRGSNAAREARLAIESHLANAQQDPELIARADQARQAIEREAAARAAAIAGFMGSTAVATSTSATATATATNGDSKSRRGTSAHSK